MTTTMHQPPAFRVKLEHQSQPQEIVDLVVYLTAQQAPSAWPRTKVALRARLVRTLLPDQVKTVTNTFALLGILILTQILPLRAYNAFLVNTVLQLEIVAHVLISFALLVHLMLIRIPRLLASFAPPAHIQLPAVSARASTLAALLEPLMRISIQQLHALSVPLAHTHQLGQPAHAPPTVVLQGQQMTTQMQPPLV